MDQTCIPIHGADANLFLRDKDCDGWIQPKTEDTIEVPSTQFVNHTFAPLGGTKDLDHL